MIEKMKREMRLSQLKLKFLGQVLKAPQTAVT